MDPGVETPTEARAPLGVAAKERTVLIVDDMPEICDYFRSIARRVRGFNVVVTTEVNSDRALELVRANKYHLVVSDYRMREVDGVEVLAAAHEHHPDGYRILMTGYNEIPTTIERIREAHVDAYIQKPLRTQELLLLLMDFVRDNEETITACRQQARELEDEGATQDETPTRAR